MATRTLPTRKKTQPAKKAIRATPTAKALSARDSVRKSSLPETSLLDSQLALFQAAWSLTPMAMIMRHQAAVLDGLRAGPNGAQKGRRNHKGQRASKGVKGMA